MTRRPPPLLHGPAGVLLWLLFVSAPCAGADDLDRLLEDLERMRVSMDIPALSLTLADRHGTRWTGAMGIADRASGRPADDGTRFRIGSVTKMFTALALLLAAQDGVLDLEAPLAGVVPDAPIENRWEATNPLRLVHLLEHTAGLPDLSREEFDTTVPMPLREALAWKAADRRTLWPPGLHHSYTNVGAGLAALALETATGQSYEDFVQRRIFAPLAMRSAGFEPDSETLATLATGYDSDGITPIPYWHMLYHAFGAINLRPADMSPLLQLLLNRGEYRGARLLPSAAIDRMEQPRTTLAAGAGLQYGYGFGNYAWLRRGILFHGHGGDGDGYLSRLGYSSERGVGYFLVINVFRSRDLARLQRRVEEYIIGDAVAAEPPVPDTSREVLASMAGEYEPVTRRFATFTPAPRAVLRVEPDGGHLVVVRRNERRRLLPVTEMLFRHDGESLATSAFVRYEGRLYFQSDLGNYVRRSDIDGNAQ